MRSHRDQGADRNNAGSTNACHEQVKTGIDGRYLWLGKRVVRRGDNGPRGIGHFASCNITFHCHETRAEAVNAGIVFIAGVLVDLPLAAERCFFGDYRQAIGLD